MSYKASRELSHLDFDSILDDQIASLKREIDNTIGDISYSNITHPTRRDTLHRYNSSEDLEEYESFRVPTLHNKQRIPRHQSLPRKEIATHFAARGSNHVFVENIIEEASRSTSSVQKLSEAVVEMNREMNSQKVYYEDRVASLQRQNNEIVTKSLSQQRIIESLETRLTQNSKHGFKYNNNLDSLQQQLAFRENEIAILRAERDTALIDLSNTRRENSALQSSLEDSTLRHTNEIASLREALYQTRAAGKNALRSLEKNYSKQLREMREVLRAAHSATEKATEELLLIHKNKAAYTSLDRPQKDHVLGFKNDGLSSSAVHRAYLLNDDDSSDSDWNYSDHAFLVMKQKREMVRRAQIEAKSPFISKTSRKFGEKKTGDDIKLLPHIPHNQSEMNFSSTLGSDSEEELAMHKVTNIEALINTRLNSLSSNLPVKDKIVSEKDKDQDFLNFAKGIKTTGKSPSLNRSCRTRSFHSAPTFASYSPNRSVSIAQSSHSVPFQLPQDDDDNDNYDCNREDIYFEKVSHPNCESSVALLSQQKSFLDNTKFEHGNSFGNLSSSGMQIPTRLSGTTLSFESINLTQGSRQNYFSDRQRQDQNTKTELVGALLSSISVSGDLLALKDEKTLDLSNGSSTTSVPSKKDRRRKQTHGKVYATPNAKPKASRLFDMAIFGSTDDSLAITEASPTCNFNEKKNTFYSASSSGVDIDANGGTNVGTTIDIKEETNKTSLQSPRSRPTQLDESIESNFDDFSVGASLFANPGRSPTALRRRKAKTIPLSHSSRNKDLKVSLSGFEDNTRLNQDSLEISSQAPVFSFPTENNIEESKNTSQSNIEHVMENMENSQSDAANLAFDFGTDSELDTSDDQQEASEFILTAGEEVEVPCTTTTHHSGLDEAFDFGTETESEVELETQKPDLSGSFESENSFEKSADESQKNSSKPSRLSEENILSGPDAYNFCLSSTDDFDEDSNDNIENKRQK